MPMLFRLLPSINKLAINIQLIVLANHPWILSMVNFKVKRKDFKHNNINSIDLMMKLLII